MRQSNAWKKALGAVLMAIGFLALITPLTPGSWLIFVGAELMGLRLAFLERARERFGRKKRQHHEI